MARPRRFPRSPCCGRRGDAASPVLTKSRGGLGALGWGNDLGWRDGRKRPGDLRDHVEVDVRDGLERGRAVVLLDQESSGCKASRNIRAVRATVAPSMAASAGSRSNTVAMWRLVVTSVCPGIP